MMVMLTQQKTTCIIFQLKYAIRASTRPCIWGPVAGQYIDFLLLSLFL